VSCSVHQEAMLWYEEQKVKRANFEKWATKIELLPDMNVLAFIRRYLRDKNIIEVGDLMAACIRAEDPDIAKRLWDYAKKAAGPLP
jgi:hypothetical protein